MFKQRNNHRPPAPADPDAPTTRLYIDQIVDKVNCNEHDRKIGEYCYEQWLEENPNHPIRGICNRRARRAGMVGHIHPASLDRTVKRGPYVQR